MTSGAPAGDDVTGDRPDLGAAGEQYRSAATELLEGLDATVEGWIVRVVNGWLRAAGVDAQDALDERVRRVAQEIHAVVMPKLTALLTADVDRQQAGPLGVLRGCVGPANQLLADAGVPPPRRDPVTESMFPDDPYGLGPANFDDVDPSLHDPGLVWGAAKAHVVILRHRS